MDIKQFVKLDERELILFDLDGTLVDSAKDIYRSMNIALEMMNREPVTEMQIRQWIGRGAAQSCACVIQYQDGVVDEAIHQQLLQNFLQTYEQNVCVDTVLYHGVAQFLEYCQKNNKKTAIVTNKPYNATIALLEALKLPYNFDCIVGGDSLKERKPSPEPLLYVIQKLNIAADKTLMIGDSRNDVEAARAAQVDCVALSYGYNHGEPLQLCNPQYIVDDLMQLL